jgi:PPP family 3-phenylpropionic acid transporter
MATKVVAPNVWGWLADRTGRRMLMVRIASLLSWLTFLGVFQARDFWGLALVMSLFSFFWNASLPQVEAVTFNHLKERVRYYASIRLWGSIGFILAVTALGQALEHWDTGIEPIVVLLLYAGLWLSSLLVPEASHGAHPANPDGLTLLPHRLELLAFFFACFMMQMSHGAYYAFYSIYLEQHGYSKALIGELWALGVAVEVLMFMVMHHLLQHYGAQRVLVASLALAVVRWLLIGGFPDDLWVLVPAQCLHAATFGTFHASAIHLVHHYFPGPIQGRGQALYSSLSFGAGGALGSLTSGYLWVAAGAGVTFTIAAVIALVGMVVAWIWVDPQRRD